MNFADAVTIRRGSRSRRCTGLLASLLTLAAILGASSASAAGAAPALRVTTFLPETVTAGKGVAMFVTVQNTGDESLSGDLSVTYDLPAGVVPASPTRFFGFNPEPVCQIVAQRVECVADVNGLATGTAFKWVIRTEVEPGAAGTLIGQIEVAGGGGGEAKTVPISFLVGPGNPFSIKRFAVEPVDPTAFSARQAGSDPTELKTDVVFPSEARTDLDLHGPSEAIVSAPPESEKDVVVHVPAGVVGIPTATGQLCTAPQLVTPIVVPPLNEPTSIPICPLQSQVGIVQLNGGDIVPLYNMVPATGSPAQFGFYYQALAVTLSAKVRPSDNGIDIVSKNISSSIPVPKFEVTLWGVPADPSHAHLRGVCLDKYSGYNPTRQCPLESERVPFLRMPTTCTGTPLGWGIEVDTYQHPGMFHQATTTTPAMEGCDRLPFEPSLSLAPSQRSADSPSGLGVDLTIPQDQGPDGLASADLRSAKVTLPKGVAINPASADGLAACTDAQLALGQEGPSACPEASKLGTVEVRTPLLGQPLEGSVFLRTQASTDPESGDLYRLAIELRSDRYGIAIKLPGSLVVGKGDGQLTATFDELPQLPFESMHLEFKSGPRAPLTTPQTCGTYAGQAVLSGWNGAVESVEPKFTVDQNCARPPFAPGFEAGVANPVAGSFSPFTLRVTRGAGQPNLSRIEATLPEGELAKLKGIPVCPDAQTAAGTCSQASRIGSAVAGIGNGSNPLYLPQAGHKPSSVYLAGPYEGAPYSVLTELPAQAGPFDLGTVLVRSALAIDPRTTQVTVTSDPLPQIFGGVPVSYRDVRVEVDRPDFTINPTDCEPTSVKGVLTPTSGGPAAVSDRFQVADCGNLGFKPTLALSLKGKTTRTGHPAVKAVLTYPQKGTYANISRAQVTLPGSEFLDQGNLNKVCTQPELKSQSCPAKSIYGRAKAWSPLLDRPLSGPVYLAVGFGYKLPALVAELGGQIRVLLVGKVDTSKDKGIRNTFEAVPDAPVERFVLELKGGRRYGLLENSENICARPQQAEARFTAQNGAVLTQKPKLQVKCPRRPAKRPAAKKH